MAHYQSNIAGFHGYHNQVPKVMTHYDLSSHMLAALSLIHNYAEQQYFWRRHIIIIIIEI